MADLYKDVCWWTYLYVKWNSTAVEYYTGKQDCLDWRLIIELPYHMSLILNCLKTLL